MQENRPTQTKSMLRLNLPRWQDGNLHEYFLGSQLLSWLAPPAKGPVETVPVPAPKPGETLEVEQGIIARWAVLDQARAARRAIEKHNLDRVVTLGGDCLIDLAPMDYLNKRYGRNLGGRWIDAYPDVLTPKEFAQGKTHVLSAHLGRGARN